MPMKAKHKDQAEQLYSRAVANTRLSLSKTESKVFDGMNTAINLYFTSMVHLIKGLEDQIDDLQAEIRKLQAQSLDPRTNPAYLTRR